MAVTNGWGQAAKNNTNGFGKLATNNIGAGSIYENSWSGDTALIGTSAAFLYSKSSFNQGEADPTPTITGTAGGSFNADAGVVFVDTGSFNSSTGQIDLSATSIDSHIITYTVDGVQSGQSVGVTAAPYSSTSSFTFDAVNDYFDAGNSTELQFSGSFSISCWVKIDNSGNNAIISKDSNPSVGNGYHIDFRGGGEVHAWAYNAGSKLEKTGLSINNWYNIVFVFESTGGSNGNQSLYINGGTPLTNSITNFAASTVKNLRIGNSEVLSGFDLGGNIDEVSIWNTALSSAAVTEIYNSGAPSELTSLTNASSSNLKAWYKMGE